MNICIDLQQFSVIYVNFLETKRNIIMDGNFTKILYSNQYFTMNGLYIYLPLEIITIEKSLNKYFLKFNPRLEKNVGIIKELSTIENKLLEYYKLYFHSKCKIVNLLSKQLVSGNIKILYDDSSNDKYNFKEDIKEKEEYNLDTNASFDMDNIKGKYILKISGIWETYEDIGLTFKLIESK